MVNQSTSQFCSECGAKNEFNVNFCSQCGTKLSLNTKNKFNINFCSQCGTKLPSNMKNKFSINFCPQCGTRLSLSPLAVQGSDSGVDDSLMRIDDLSRRISKGYKMSLSGVILAIFCFFMPWIFISYTARPVAEMSGWELITGTTIDKGHFIQKIPGEPILFLVLLAGIIVFLLAYLSYRRRIIKPLDGYGLTGLGILSLLILFIQLSGFREQVIQEGLYPEYQFSFWGVVLGYTAIIIGGILNLRKLIKSTGRSQNIN